MPAIRTHSGRGRLLAAALWSATYVLLGCTDGLAEPFGPDGAGAQKLAGRGAAGHGAAGRGGAGHGAAGQQLSAGNHGAADGGDGHVDAGNGGLVCGNTPPWSDANATQEDLLFGMLNVAIERQMKCADRGTFSRMPFPMMDDPLRCISRQDALEALTGMPWGKPPSPQQGPGHDPFDPSTPDAVAPWTQMSPSGAAMDLLSNPSACAKLMSPKYTRVGVGYIASTWAITLAGE